VKDLVQSKKWTCSCGRTTVEVRWVSRYEDWQVVSPMGVFPTTPPFMPACQHCGTTPVAELLPPRVP
jgi:hypothetical protein